MRPLSHGKHGVVNWTTGWSSANRNLSSTKDASGDISFRCNAFIAVMQAPDFQCRSYRFHRHRVLYTVFRAVTLTE